jgi:hypothetical protein
MAPFVLLLKSSPRHQTWRFDHNTFTAILPFVSDLFPALILMSCKAENFFKIHPKT